MKKIVFLLVPALILFSCGKSGKNRDLSQFEDVILTNDNKIFLHDAICDIEAIPLESSDKIVVGHITNVIVTDENIITYSMFHSPLEVHIFDRDGKHRSSISRMGRGPQEYVSIHHVALLPDNETIAINDNNSKKILYFDLDGNFISSTPTPFWFLRMEYIDKNNVLCATYGIGKSDPGLADLENPENAVFITDEKFNIKNGFLPKRYDRSKFHWNTHNLKKFGNDIYINLNYTDTFYKVEGHGLKPVFRLNLDQIGGTALLDPSITNEEFAQLKKEKANFPGWFVVTDDYLVFFVLMPDNTISTYLYSKKTKKSYSVGKDLKYSDDLLVNLISVVETQINNKLATYIQAHGIASRRKELAEQRPELAGVKEDDNPVIVLYRFKEGL